MISCGNSFLLWNEGNAYGTAKDTAGVNRGNPPSVSWMFTVNIFRL